MAQEESMQAKNIVQSPRPNCVRCSRKAKNSRNARKLHTREARVNDDKKKSKAEVKRIKMCAYAGTKQEENVIQNEVCQHILDEKKVANRTAIPMLDSLTVPSDRSQKRGRSVKGGSDRDVEKTRKSSGITCHCALSAALCSACS